MVLGLHPAAAFADEAGEPLAQDEQLDGQDDESAGAEEDLAPEADELTAQADEAGGLSAQITDNQPDISGVATYTGEAAVTISGSTTGYPSFDEAWKAWDKAPNGSTLTLRSDVNVGPFYVSGTKTLDLNGHTLKINKGSGDRGILINKTVLTLKDSSGGKGLVTSSLPTTITVEGNNPSGGHEGEGQLNFESGTISNTFRDVRTDKQDGIGIFVNQGGRVTMTGGTIRDCGRLGAKLTGRTNKGKHEFGHDAHFIMEGGLITACGSEEGDYGEGAVLVNGTGLLYLDNGEITGNYSASSKYAGGVTLLDNSAAKSQAFLMEGGSITNNSGKKYGALYVGEKSDAELCGGRIEGNAARDAGGVGGVYLSPKAGVERDDRRDGQDVSFSALQVAGDVFIQHNRCLADNKWVNVYLGKAANTGRDRVCWVNVSSDKAFTEGASVGVTVENPPTGSATRTISYQYYASTPATLASKYLTSDDNNYYVDYDTNKNAAILRRHTHQFTFAKGPDNTLTATCSGAGHEQTCDVNAPIAFELNALDKDYDGTPADVWIATYEGWWNVGLEVPARITYRQNGVPLRGAPVNHGSYTAEVSFSYEGKTYTVSKGFTINQVNYTVHYEPNAEGVTGSIKDQTLNVNEYGKLARGSTYKRTGYSFAGWTTNRDGSGEKYSSNQQVRNIVKAGADSITLYAQWKPISYTISYNANGASGTMKGETLKYGQEYWLPNGAQAYKRMGHSFTGWKDDKGNFYDVGAKVSNLADTDMAVVKLYAQWKVNEYTVTFDPNADSVTKLPAGQSVTYGNWVPFWTIGNPEREGYLFTGWYEDKACEKPRSLSMPVTEDITLYAGWQQKDPNKCVVFFDTAGGSRVAPLQVTVGQKATRPENPTRYGHTFVKWHLDDADGAEYAFTETVNKDIVLVAEWTPNTHEVKVDESTKIGTEDAKTEGGSITGAPTDTVATDTEVTFSVETKVGYRIDEFSVTAGETGIAYYDVPALASQAEDGATTETYTFTMPDEDVTIKVVFTPVTYAIMFDANALDAKGSSGDMGVMNVTYDVSEPLTANSFARENHKFIGWNTDPDGNGTPFTDKQDVVNLANADGALVTLYAQWEFVEPKTDDDLIPLPEPKVYYSVFYAPNGGQGSMKPQTFVEGSEVTLDQVAFTRGGYAFEGWNTAADGSGTAYANGAKVKPTGDLTLYAQWKEVPTPEPEHVPSEEIEANPTYLMIKFDANEGTGSMDEMTFEEGSEVTLTVNAFTRDGYEFTGWNTEEDGSGMSYADKATFTPEDNMLLFAQWKKAESNPAPAPAPTPAPKQESKPQATLPKTSDPASLAAILALAGTGAAALAAGTTKRRRK